MPKRYVCNDMIDCYSYADMAMPGTDGTGIKPKYSQSRDYRIGDGSENGTFTDQSDKNEDWSREDMKETGLNLRKPL